MTLHMRPPPPTHTHACAQIHADTLPEVGCQSSSDSETPENDAEGLHVYDCHQIMRVII